MINFNAFADEFVKIAQYPQYRDPNRKAKLVGGATGMGLGAAGGASLLKRLGRKGAIAGGVGGALIGGLGGREVAEGAVTAGRGLKMTAGATRQALR